MKLLTPSIMKWILAGIILSTSALARAACDGQREWSHQPTNEIKLVVGYEPELPDFSYERAGYDAIAFLSPPPAQLIGQHHQRQLSKSRADAISYLEPDGKGTWRVCRIERWMPPGAGGSLDTQEKWLERTRIYTAGDKFVRNMTQGHVIHSATFLYYDQNGRLERVSERNFNIPGQPVQDVGCRRYDQKHRLLMSIRTTVSGRCPVNQPDVRDSWFEFRYGGTDKWGNPQRLLVKTHNGQADGKWFEQWKPFTTGSSFEEPWGNADVTSTHGVKLIWGADIGHRDNNPANTVLDSYGQKTGMNYEFIRPPVPVEVLHNANSLYKYERRRYTRIADGVKLYELFPPNVHLARHRYYLLDDLVVRHEQLNADGTLKRVITLNNYLQPFPGPRSLIDDSKLSNEGILLHQVYHRVYDIDPNGKPKLVAMSWDRKMRINPWKKVPVFFADLVYGTPDGRERWKSKAEFEKTFDTSSEAAHVFPDLVPALRSKNQ